MAHVEIAASLIAFAGLAAAWFAVPAGSRVQPARRSTETATVTERVPAAA